MLFLYSRVCEKQSLAHLLIYRDDDIETEVYSEFFSTYKNLAGTHLESLEATTS